MSKPSKRFRVAFSFAGENRDFVEKVAAILADRFGQEAILYDRYHEAELANPNLALSLPDYYRRDVDLIVAVLCPNYESKHWCCLELQAIRAMIKEGKAKQIMLTCFDRADGGFQGRGGFIYLDDKTPERTAILILERLALNKGLPKDHYLKPADDCLRPRLGSGKHSDGHCDPPSMSVHSKRFRVAFSFAGETREFVEKVARLLAVEFGKKAILYDKYHEAEFARRDLGIYLPELYHKQSDLVVVVLSPAYDPKQWTGLEWTAIHDLLSQRMDNEVLLCRFGHATVRGLYSTAGFIELDGRTEQEIASLILERLALNEGRSMDSVSCTPAASFPGTTPPAGPPRRSYGALKKWQEKLDYLEEALATVVGPAEKFALKAHIQEAKDKIAELGG